MLSLKEYLSNPKMTAIVILEHFGQWLPDKLYLKIMFRIKMGYRLDLKNPKTYNEKLQWIKLYDRKPEYTMMVDKYAVKDYVAKKIGDEYVIPTLGVWERPEDIDFDSLPNQFVLKTTHGGGSSGVIICKDKTTFDRKKAIDNLNISMKQDIYSYLKEWPYKNVKPRVIAEKYVAPPLNETDLPDYKWFCFNGEPKFCQVIQGRSQLETIDFFDIDWKHQDFVGLNTIHGTQYGQASEKPARPKNLEIQIRIAKELSRDLPFSRIDLYAIDNKTFFGEVTFFPTSGFGIFTPERYNEIIGDMIELPGQKRGGV